MYEIWSGHWVVIRKASSRKVTTIRKRPIAGMYGFKGWPNLSTMSSALELNDSTWCFKSDMVDYAFGGKRKEGKLGNSGGRDLPAWRTAYFEYSSNQRRPHKTSSNLPNALIVFPLTTWAISQISFFSFFFLLAIEPMIEPSTSDRLSTTFRHQAWPIPRLNRLRHKSCNDTLRRQNRSWL